MSGTINDCPLCGASLSYVSGEGVPHLCFAERRQAMTTLDWLKGLLSEVKSQSGKIDYEVRWRIAAAIEPIIKEIENAPHYKNNRNF